jgi:hypothetical protein
MIKLNNSLFLSLCLIVCLSACNKPHHKRAKHHHSNAGNHSNKVITSPCAVYINPTIRQIDSMKTKGDSNDFYTIADDNQYYMYLSSQYLDSLKVRQINAESKGTMAFKTQSGQVFKVRLDTLYWGLILFNGKSQPIIADITDVDIDYKKYMQN